MTFSQSQVTKALKKAVEAKGGGYVYPHARPPYSYENSFARCSYTNADGSPSCIVGHVVAALDPSVLEKVGEYERESGESFGVEVLVTGFDEFGRDYEYDEYDEPIEPEPGYPILAKDARFEVDGMVQAALAAAQTVQDMTGTWAEALDAYKRVLAGEGRYAVEAYYRGLIRKRRTQGA